MYYLNAGSPFGITKKAQNKHIKRKFIVLISCHLEQKKGKKSKHLFDFKQKSFGNNAMECH